MKNDFNKNILKFFYKKVLNCIISYNSLVLAFSGGLDSTVLLDILYCLKNFRVLLNEDYNIPIFNFRVIHINHNLNKYSDFWEKHCIAQCKKYDLFCEVISVNINIYSSCNIESSARNIRYKTLISKLKYGEVLLTAHHKDDQVETLFLALKRGSGPHGLSGMVKDKLFCNQYRLIRPFLDFNKKFLKLYAVKRQLHWIEDMSNYLLNFDRNFIRLKIIPFLNKRWPWFNRSVLRSSKLCAEQELLLDELLSNILNLLIYSDGSINLSELKIMSVIKRNAILRRWFIFLGLKMPSSKNLIYLWNYVVLSKIDSIAVFQFGDWQIRRFQDRLYILSIYHIYNIKKKIIKWSLSDMFLRLPVKLGVLCKNIIDTVSFLSIYKNFDINYINKICLFNNIQWRKNFFFNKDYNFSNIVFNYYGITLVRSPYLNEKVSIRFGSASGLIYIVGKIHGRKLKKLWQELNIPIWQRKIIPLLFYNEILISAIGVFVTHEGKINFNLDKQWFIYWSSSYI